VAIEQRFALGNMAGRGKDSGRVLSHELGLASHWAYGLARDSEAFLELGVVDDAALLQIDQELLRDEAATF